VSAIQTPASVTKRPVGPTPAGIGCATDSLAGPREVAVVEEPLKELKSHELLIDAIVSGVSAGTELNVFRGLAPQWRQRMDPSTRLFIKDGNSDWK
jgi:hypothetical protein